MITCKRCGRVLTSVASQAAGMGRQCAALDALAADYKPAQVEKARELVADRAIESTPLRTDRGLRVFTVVASSGRDRYFTTRTACTCPAGLKGRRCYHRAALVLRAAS